MVVEDKGLRVEESFAHVQTVEFFAVVAISRETSTSTGQLQWLQGIERRIHVQWDR